MRLLLIRHGQTPANVLGQLDTASPGPRLTELGMLQARQIPAALKDEAVESLHASTLVRTQLTASPLSDSRGLDIAVREGFREIEAGDLEGRSDTIAIRTYMETVFAWGTGELDAAMPGGPDGHDFFGRYNAEIEAVTTAGVSTAAVVSHGAAIRVWVAANAVNVPPRFAAENQLDNTGIVILDGTFSEGWTLTRWAGRPIGGEDLADDDAADPTGDTLSDSLDEAIVN